jgi:dihydrofolate reductase
MSSLTCHISMSLDGFVAGPNQSVKNPLGEGGMRLHQWAFATESWREQHGGRGGERNVDADVVDEVVQGVGAYIMGRKMFGGGDGPWDESWTGWWGEDPPYHTPVFVLTHHPREPLPMRHDLHVRHRRDRVSAGAGACGGGRRRRRDRRRREHRAAVPRGRLARRALPPHRPGRTRRGRAAAGERGRSGSGTGQGRRLAGRHARQVPRLPLSGGCSRASNIRPSTSRSQARIRATTGSGAVLDGCPIGCRRAQGRCGWRQATDERDE